MVQTKEEKAISWSNYSKQNRETLRIRSQAYRKTPQGKKRDTISNWKRRGTIGDLKGFYDDIYLPAEKCHVCKNKFKSNRDKTMDHNHLTKEIRFVLCRSCNCHDYWKKHIAANRIAKNFKILLQIRLA